jgi:hypothetical protein
LSELEAPALALPAYASNFSKYLGGVTRGIL